MTRSISLSLALCLATTLLAQERAEPACQVARSERFAFHSDPWINLHHFLFQWARNLPEGLEGDRRGPTRILEAGDLAELSAEDRAAWMTAVDFYRAELASGNLLFNDWLENFRNRLIALECDGDLGEATDVEPEVREALASTMPIYRARWWPAHDRANRAWIAEQAVLLDQHGGVLAARLAEAYGGVWPEQRLRIDVGFYGNWAGGYTSNDPTVLTLEGRSFPGLRGLEMIFHEVSHAWFLQEPLERDLDAAFTRLGAKTPRLLSHTIQFTTTPILLRARLSDDERTAFQSFSEEVLTRGRMREQYAVVQPRWQAYLSGAVTRRQALTQIAADLNR